MDAPALLSRLVALALPPRCPGCGTIVEADHRFCVACWTTLTFLPPEGCARCGLPLDVLAAPDAFCEACDAHPPRHDGVRAAVAYAPIARAVALKLKYGGRMGLAVTMALAIRRVAPDDLDLLVPVPLHRWRLWSRGYNQAALIARAVAAPLAVPVANALARHQPTPVLRGMGPAARARAVAGAFRIDPEQTQRLSGAKVGLVDDVFTSGATVNACADVLKRAGAASVVALCWARVLPGDTMD